MSRSSTSIDIDVWSPGWNPEIALNPLTLVKRQLETSPPDPVFRGKYD